MTVAKKILVIDDDRMLHSMLRPIFASYDLDVISAMSGEEGLAIASSEKPDMIFLDVMMPTIKGREVCKALKASLSTSDIPVVFLTAKDSDDDVKAELEAGALGHVSKPVNTAQLVKLVKKVLGI